MKQKTVLLVGYYVSHVVGSKVDLLRSMGYTVYALDIRGFDFPNNIYEIPSSQRHSHADPPHAIGRVARYIKEATEVLRNYGIVPERADESSRVRDILRQVNPDLVWGVWGAGVLRWLRAFRTSDYDGKMVWTANVIPNRIRNYRWVKWASEGALYRNWLHRMDGLILTDERMREYVWGGYPRTKGCSVLLQPDFMPRRWFDDAEKTFPHNDGPRVVFLGAPERYGDVIDQVDLHLVDLADSGIHVHCARPKEMVLQHPRIHFYDRFSDASFVNGEYGRFIGKFDAVVVLYNLTGYHPRFASTFPTRIVTALCGRIPIFVKDGLLRTCEEFVEKNEIGKPYRDGGHLKSMLTDDALMKRLRQNAARNDARFSSDCAANRQQLEEFLERL